MNREISLFDAIRIAKGTLEELAIDYDEFLILRDKTPEQLKAIAKVKEVFGLEARVRK